MIVWKVLSVDAIRHPRKRFLWTALVVVPLSLSAQKDVASAGFERDIAPIFKENCAMCHGGPTPQAELDLTSEQGVLKGGKSGKAIVPGSAARSLLIEKVASGTMPPGKNKLDEKTVSLIRRWIDTGTGVTPAGSQLSSAEAITENDFCPSSRCGVCSVTANAGRRAVWICGRKRRASKAANRVQR